MYNRLFWCALCNWKSGRRALLCCHLCPLCTYPLSSIHMCNLFSKTWGTHAFNACSISFALVCEVSSQDDPLQFCCLNSIWFMVGSESVKIAHTIWALTSTRARMKENAQIFQQFYILSCNVSNEIGKCQRLLWWSRTWCMPMLEEIEG